MYAASGEPGWPTLCRSTGWIGGQKPSAGPAKLHLSRGDVYSAEVTREDVALVTVATLIKEGHGPPRLVNQVEVSTRYVWVVCPIFRPS
jgi:hypothetical protein